MICDRCGGPNAVPYSPEEQYCVECSPELADLESFIDWLDDGIALLDACHGKRVTRFNEFDPGD